MFDRILSHESIRNKKRMYLLDRKRIDCDLCIKAETLELLGLEVY